MGDGEELACEAERGAGVGEAHGDHHERAALEGHALLPSLVEEGIDVGAGEPEIAPGDLDRGEPVEGEK